MTRLVFGCLVIAFLIGPTASGYNPPTDTAGPLVVRIEGPEEVSQLDAAQPVRVVLENRAERRIEGTVELGLVDRWRAEPAGPVAFAVEPKSSLSRAFQIVAGQGTYSAHYPVHAWARFTWEGKPAVAHPILILQAKLPRTARPPAPVEWKPFKLPEGGQLALWQLRTMRAVIAVPGQPPQVMPAGWQGNEPRTGGTAHLGRQAIDSRTADGVVMHPPWKSGAGTIVAEYPIELPKTGPIRLAFDNGVSREGQGDGVTFRVRMVPLDAPAGQLGKIVFERHVRPHEAAGKATADLTSFAGRGARLQLESHPGPKNNTGWDSSFWAEPTLVAGDPAAKPAGPMADRARTGVLGKAGPGEAFEIRVQPRRRGLLDAAVLFAAPGTELRFEGFEVRVQGMRLDDPRSPAVLVEAREEPAESGCRFRHRFQSEAGTFDLVLRMFVDRGALRAQFQLENAPAPKPWQAVRLEDVACGKWHAVPSHVYAGDGNVIRGPGTFRLALDGHRLATSFVGLDFPGGSIVQAVDVPPEHFAVDPGDQRCSLHTPHPQIMTFIPAANVWDAVKVWREVNGLKAAGGVEKAAGRFVFDVWGGRYQETADALQRSVRYGLTDSMLVFHNWQRWGYDYRLPDIYPPNPQLGTMDQIQALAKTCRDAGVLFAPHDNYIDLYPDAEGFSCEENLAFHADGTPVRAWFNEGRKAQSYRFRADRVAPFLQRNLRWIKDGMAPTAYFIDVWSSAGPYDYWTAQGRFFDRVFTRDSWGGHFAWIRELLGGAPQISESGHDQLIGWLDGAQANHLRVGKPGPFGRNRWCTWDIPHQDAERTPWFDAAHHARFVKHGAGYPGRYEGGLDPRLHGIYSDDYITTEVLTGHPAMAREAFSRSTVRKYWLLHDLMRTLAGREIESVQYAGGDLHRQHVRWSGGSEVWVNRGDSDWEVAGTVLPQFGFLARTRRTGSKCDETSIARQTMAGERGMAVAAKDGTFAREPRAPRGIIVEMARSANQLYVNGRQTVEGPLPIRVSVENVRYAGQRKVELALRWQADAPIPAGFAPFLHFCDEHDEIAFQPSHQPGRFDAERQGAFSASAVAWIPEKLAPGQTFELRAGIYRPRGGVRLALSGADDGTHRIRLGKIRLEGAAGLVSGIAWTPQPAQPDPLLARQNPQGKPIDFGPLVTAGGLRLTTQDQTLLVTPLPDPRGKKFEVRIRWSALPWPLPQPTRLESLAEDGRVLSSQPVNIAQDEVVLTVEPEVFAYRLCAKAPH